MKTIILNVILTLASMSAFASDNSLQQTLLNIDPTSREQGQRIKSALNNDIELSEFKCEYNGQKVKSYIVDVYKMDLSNFLLDQRSNLIINTNFVIPSLSAEYQENGTVATAFFNISNDLMHVQSFQILKENIVTVQRNEGTLLEPVFKTHSERKIRFKILCSRIH